MLQVSHLSIPPGPAIFKELFDWHHFNAQTLMANAEMKANFISLLTQYDSIVLHENYAGTGNAGSSLYQQFCALKQAVLSDIPLGCLAIG